jgi:3-methyladenine DNA glycosylase AlkD
MKDLHDKFKELYKQIEKFCFDREDPVRAIRNLNDFSEGYDAFGLEDEDIKILRDRILDTYDFSPRDYADFGLYLLKTGKYEFGTLAIMLVKKHRPRLDPYIREKIKEWLDTGVENWAHADMLGIKILPVLFELELVDLSSFSSWRDSRSKWTRRAAVVSLIWLKKALPAQEILPFVEPLLRDKERVVQQALGWLFKDLWNRATEATEEFLEAHKDSMDALVLKQATSQMPLNKAKKFMPAKHSSPNPQANPRNKKYNPNKQRPRRPNTGRQRDNKPGDKTE